MQVTMTRKDIFKRIEKGELSAEKGIALIRQNTKLGKPPSSTSDQVSKTHYFRKVLAPSPLTEGAGKTADKSRILLFDDDDRLHQMMLAASKETDADAQLLLVRPGAGFGPTEAGGFSVRPDSEDDYLSLFQTLHRNGGMPGRFVFNWAPDIHSLDDDSLKDSCRLAIYALFSFFRALSSLKNRNSVHVLFCYSGTQEDAPHLAALGAFARTLSQENPEWGCSVIGFDKVGDREKTSALLNELNEGRTSHEINYRRGGRFTVRWQAFQVPEGDDPRFPLREGGVYLITGGAGGLGLSFAGYFAKRSRVKLALCGRSPLDKAKEARLEAMRAGGAEIIYLRCDITRANEVEGLVSEIRRQLGPLNGVLHGAGQIQDAFLLNKSRADFGQVIAPKLWGTVFLDRATREEPLDFFVLFSSIAGALGSVGQTDYAYANHFLEGYAQYRARLVASGTRSGKSLTIHWPLWRDGGMRPDEETLAWRKAHLGLELLDGEQGLQSFFLGLSLDPIKIMVLQGKAHGLDGLLQAANRMPRPNRTVTRELDPGDRDTYLGPTQAFLKRILSKVSKVPDSRIRSDEPFETVGIDSLMIMTLTRELEDHFGELPKTLFFEYQDLTELSEYFLKNHRDTLLKHLPSSQGPPPRPSVKPGPGRPSPTSSRFISKEIQASRERQASYVQPPPNGDVAIIGVAGRYPGAENVDDFWKNLKLGKDCITEVPPDRWDLDHYYEPDKKKIGKHYSKWGGFMEDVDKFDPLFFNISPKEAELIDPQERLLLENVWHTLEDAAYTRSQLSRKKVGVFVGVMYGYYHLVGVERSLNANSLVSGTSYASIANRVSYLFNFTGPSLALDSMCSSSLTAIHLACRSIQQNECEMAVASGVNVTIHPHKYQMLSQGGFASTDGRCRSFGAGGDGYVPGEGIGSVLLKPLHRAVADNDRIYAVIKSTAINHGGKTNGYSVPNPKAQANLISEALGQAGMTSSDLSYIEAHGTGTSLGDPIEIVGLARAFAASPQQTMEPGSFPIGSVKSNIGHLESAAGIAALTKVLLQMRHRKLVPSLHSGELNPNIQFKETPFYVQQTLDEWRQPVQRVNGELKSMPRRAGISSFGAGGANAHVILEEFPDAAPIADHGADQTHLILLSARTEEALDTSIQRMLQFIQAEGLDSGSVPMNSDGPDVRETLRELSAAIAEVGKNQITTDENLSGFGFGPLKLARLAGQIQSRFQVDFNPELFTKHQTLEAVASYLQHQKNKTLADAAQPDAAQPNAAQPDAAQPNAAQPDAAQPDAAQPDLSAGFNPRIRLLDLAYTLQVGREHLSQRLALSVSSLHELEDKLKHILKGGAKEVPEGVFLGSLQAGDSSKDLLVGGRAGREFVNILLEDGEWEKLAELWLSGVDLPWQMLYQRSNSLKPRRIGLPLYPFARDRYWVASDAAPGASLGRLHPMIDANVSIIGESRFSFCLQPDNEWLVDRLSQGHKIWPALALLEMARAAGTLSGEKKVARIEKMVWGKSLQAEGQPMDVQVGLFPGGTANRLEYEIRSCKQAHEPVIHAQGVMSFEAGPGRTAPEKPPSRDELRQRCPTKISAVELYQRLRGLGFLYRPEQQALNALHTGPKEAWAEVRFGVPNQKGMESMAYHPLVLDAGLQAALLWMTAESLGTPSRAWPLSLAALTFHEPFPEVLDIHIKFMGNRTEGTISNNTFEILFRAPGGAVLARMEDVRIPVETVSQITAPPVKTVPLRKQVEDELLTIVSRLVKVPPSNISVHTSLTEYGFESMTVVSLAEEMNALYGFDLSPAVFYEKDTIGGLAEYLIREYESKLADLYGQNISTAPMGGTPIHDLEKPLQTLIKKQTSLGSYASRDLWANREPIAIVGIGGRFPLSPDLDSFWENLKNEKDMISEVPPDRWNWKDFHADHAEGPLQTACKWGGFISDADKFDARFFKISPMEAEMMDPQQRIFLETVWKTIEDAGYKASSFSGRRIGLFVGVQFNDYQQMLANQGVVNPQMGIGNEHSILVNRISYLLNLRGPSEPYNTACSSSLVAVNRAVNSIRTGESEMAIAGGVTLMVSPYTTISGDQGGVLSPDGRCKTLDSGADGYVRGEGVGAVLLKRLDKAIEDHDHIYAVVKGVAINHGGKASSLTAPNSEAQAALLTDAYQEAGVDPEAISYIELHGTGTKLGDPVEIEGIKASFRELARQRGNPKLPEGYCGLGSVKTNIGHLEPASGLAGLMKLILALRHKTLPGILHLKDLNPYVKLQGTPFFVVDRTQAWEPLKDEDGAPLPRVAGVSSFGFGGTNAHVVLEEYKAAARECESGSATPRMVVLSAKTEERLKAYAQVLAQFLTKELASDSPVSLENLAFTLAVGREESTERLAMVASDLATVLDKLLLFHQGDVTGGDFFRGKVSKAKTGDDGDSQPALLAETKQAEDIAILCQHWVNGGAVDWRPDPEGPQPYRVPLPTYPFERKRYWALSDQMKAVELPASPGEKKPEAVATSAPTGNKGDYVLNELHGIFAQELNTPIEDFDLDTNFADYGVDSIIGTIITQKIQERFGDFVALTILMEYSTFGELKDYVTEETQLEDISTEPVYARAGSTKRSQSKVPPELVALNRKGSQQPSYWVHGGPGYAALYQGLSEILGPDYPFYAFQAKGVDNKTIPHTFDEMVEHYIHCIKCVQPEGPYIIGGLSYGGLVAYEISQRLHQRGDDITQLFIFDTLPTSEEGLEIFSDHYGQDDNFLTLLMANELAGSKKAGKALITLEELMEVHERVRVDQAAKLAKERGSSFMSADEIYNFIRGCIKLCDVCGVTYATYRQQPYHASPVNYFKAEAFLGSNNWVGTESHDFFKDHDYVGIWRSRCRNGFKQVNLPSDHFNMLESPALEIAAAHVAKTINPLLDHWEPPRKKKPQTSKPGDVAATALAEGTQV